MITLKNSEQASALYALVVSAVFTFLSFYDTDAENYLFPRIIAIALALLSIALFISNSAASSDTPKRSAVGGYFGDVWPGLLIGLIFLLVMEDVGFYVSSFLAFLAILVVYGNRPVVDLKALMTKSAISAVFMFILYLLFWNGLNVRTPTGLIF